MAKSKLFKVNNRDLKRGLTVTLLATLFTGIISITNSETLEWSMLSDLIKTAISAASSYMLLNLATNENGKVLKK